MLTAIDHSVSFSKSDFVFSDDIWGDKSNATHPHVHDNCLVGKQGTRKGRGSIHRWPWFCAGLICHDLSRVTMRFMNTHTCTHTHTYMAFAPWNLVIVRFFLNRYGYPFAPTGILIVAYCSLLSFEAHLAGCKTMAFRIRETMRLSMVETFHCQVLPEGNQRRSSKH